MADENTGDTAGTAVAGAETAAGSSETEATFAEKLAKLKQRETDLTRIVSEKEGALRDLQSRIDKAKAAQDKAAIDLEGSGQNGNDGKTSGVDEAALDREFIDAPGRTAMKLISPLEQQVRKLSADLEAKQRELATKLDTLEAKSDADYQANKETIDALMSEGGLTRSKAMSVFAKMPKAVQGAARVPASGSSESQAAMAENETALPPELEALLSASPVIQAHTRGMKPEEVRAILTTAHKAEKARVKGRHR